MSKTAINNQLQNNKLQKTVRSLQEAWHVANQANLFLLDAIEERHLGDRYARHSRPVAAQFAHMHNVRIRRLAQDAPNLAAQVAQYPRGAELTKKDLLDALKSSAQVMGEYIARCEAQGFVNNWEGTPATFLAYIVAHEAHHRGLAMAALHSAGHQQPDEVIYGLWEWG